MPGKIKVKVLAGRNLPVMDRAGDTTDAFVEIKFGGVTHKTDVCRKSLNPHWNSTEWYRFEVDESELQDEPLQLRLMDHDTYSANDAIGKVVISLAPLLARDTAHTNKTPAAATPSGAVMSGWIPVLDTMHGIRGELNVIVKVELFSDFNKYKTSSCGVQFFHCPMIPPGYRASAIHGFVEELVVNDDPEYQWIDKIRTPRASNEARQVAFIKLGNQVQRLVGLKAAELGANAVVGYQQDFDLEGEAGVVARAIGTAVSITPLPTPSIPTNIPPCSQQQLKQYLDILSTDNENIPDLNQYFSTHQDELQKLVSILHPKYSSNFLDEGENPDDEEPSNSLMRQSSIKSYTDSVSIYQDEYASHKSFQTITEDQTDLNKLLNRIEKDNSDADSDSSGPMQTIKKIKSNFFVKKLGSLRRKSDKSEKSNKANERDDTVSIKSNSSDTSKISLSDLKNEFKKRLKKPKFRKPQFKNLSDQGVGMASILARSVIHAHTSLACIAETQDSETSPASTLRRTSESEPTINMTDEEIQKLQPKIVPEIFEEDDYESGPPVDRCVSLKDLNLEQDKNVLPVERPRKTSESCPSTPVAARQENLLALPGNESYFGSASSVVSGESSEMYSSSEGSEDSSDLKTDTDRSIETTSSVVHIVLAHDVNPTLVEQMERKLSIISGTTPEPEATPTDQNREPSNAPEVENNKNELRETEKASTSTDAKPEPSERDRDREKERDRGSPRHTRHESCGKEMTAVAASALNSSLNSTSTPVGMHRRSSDSDLSITPKGSSLNASGNTGSGGGAILRPSMNSNNLELLEYPFLTMSHYPHGFIVNIGGCVCARSVKLVDGGSALAMRAAWWAELRTEVRAHARALRCNALLAYKETANICEDVCVLSASGTAAVINLDCDLNTEIDANIAGQNGSKTAVDDFESLESCGVAHIPYSPAAAPSSERYHCGHCRRARVPSVLLATCAKPNRLTSHSKAITLTAVAARARRAPPQSEPGARDISDQLPFLEYELHKLLLAKLRMQGANAIFNLQTQIAIGERCVMALASGTAVRLAALPPPTPPRIKASEKDKDALDIQRALWDAFTANKAANGYDIIPDVSLAPLSLSDAEEPPALELCADKDAALLELDEAEDVETARSLAVRRQHMPVFCYGMKPKAAAPPQAFVQVIRARFPLSSVGGATVAAERHVARALDVVTYKLRRLSPAALIEPAFQLELPEDEIQLVLSGAALQLQDPSKPEPATNGTHDVSNNNGTPADGPLVHSQASGDGDDEIFALDEEQAPRQEKVTESFEEKNVVLNGQVPTTVSLTSQAVIPGARIVRRICLLRLLFVRETTTVRELGGLSGFLHALTSEVMAIVRAYTAALGGNALTSFYITQLMLQDNAHKNQGQCLMSVGGDVVHITY